MEILASDCGQSRMSGKKNDLFRVWTKKEMERVKGIEPSYAAWEAAVLPLNYTRHRKQKQGNPAPGPDLCSDTAALAASPV